MRELKSGGTMPPQCLSRMRLGKLEGLKLSATHVFAKLGGLGII